MQRRSRTQCPGSWRGSGLRDAGVLHVLAQPWGPRGCLARRISAESCLQGSRAGPRGPHRQLDGPGKVVWPRQAVSSPAKWDRNGTHLSGLLGRLGQDIPWERRVSPQRARGRYGYWPMLPVCLWGLVCSLQGRLVLLLGASLQGGKGA